MREREPSRAVAKEPCPKCGSRDNLARYDDGHAYCFSQGCRYYERAQGEPAPRTSEHDREHRGGLIDGRIADIKNRHLTEETCRLFGYMVSDFHGKHCHVAPYRDRKGQVVAQKIRLPGKQFTILGDAKAMGLFGDHIWSKGKRIVITEGEIDAMSVSQAMGNKWPVVSVPNGAQSAARAITNAYEYLDAFEEVVLMFDQDDPGREAAAECAAILPPGKAKIATLPLKDANDCLKAGEVQAIVQAMWNARPWRPDGIVTATELREKFLTPKLVTSLAYPWEGLNRLTHGMREGELSTWLAGSGVGKTTIVRQIAHHLHTQHGEKVGLLMLEESNERTLDALVGLQLGKNVLVNKRDIPPEELARGFDELFADREMYLYDHFGSTEVDNVCNRIRHLARACGCRWIVLDHISILVSGQETNDERKLIDMAMTRLRTLVQETGIGLHLVSHLRRPQGDKGHEDGARVSAGQARGSHAIIQLSDMVFGLQKPEDDPHGTGVEALLLKNRFSGETGPLTTLHYDLDTGRYSESPF